jgi:hypothetical protein
VIQTLLLLILRKKGLHDLFLTDLQGVVRNDILLGFVGDSRTIFLDELYFLLIQINSSVVDRIGVNLNPLTLPFDRGEGE